MKLTNISLAILVALGLAACGGSDDNNDQTTDPKTPPKKEEPKKEETPIKDEEPKGDSALDPKRAAPTMTVPADVKAIVDGNKRLYVDRGFSDTALGYGEDGYSYDEDLGTNPGDVKLTSTYNFFSQRDIVTGSIADDANKPAGPTELAKGYTKASVGAIYVGDWENTAKEGEDNGTVNAFVKVAGSLYARVRPNLLKEKDKNEYTPKTTYVFVEKAKDNDKVKAIKDKEFSQKQVVFIANAADAGEKSAVIDLGTYGEAYDLKKGEVFLSDITVFGKKYSADSSGKNLEFGGLDPMKEIQTAKVTGSYTIDNNKNTAPNIDDKRITKSIDLGAIKAYNLPFSIAMVTTNTDEDNPVEKDIFNVGSAFNVLGFQTVSLPQNGRALYTGSSFNAKNTGDVTLYADFFEDRAGVEGVINNRKSHDGAELPTLSLKRISFLDNGKQDYKTGGAGDVTGDASYADAWTVQLYGPEAEEAAGRLYLGGVDGGKVKADAKVVEVYNTQRGGLTNKSNTADTK